MPQTVITLSTHGQGFYEFTDQVAEFVRTAAAGGDGLLTVFVRHTSCSLLIQENADPDMPAHIKAALMQVSIGIPVMHGRLALGTWQGIYLFEHRDRPHRREIVLHFSA